MDKVVSLTQQPCDGVSDALIVVHQEYGSWGARLAGHL